MSCEGQLSSSIQEGHLFSRVFANFMPNIRKAGVVIRRPSDGRLLCVKQRASGFWGWSKGGREPGESVSQCALREFREELGCDAELLESEPSIRDHKAGIAFFCAQLKPDSIISIDRRELCAYEWLTEDELANRCTSNTTRRVLQSGILKKL